MNTSVITLLKRSALAVVIVLAVLPANSQHIREPLPQPEGSRAYPTGDAIRSAINSMTTMGMAGIVEPTIRWSNKVARITARDHSLTEVGLIKAAKLQEKHANYDPNVQDDFGMMKSIQPSVGSNFEANWSLQQTPPDNSMAISNGGLIVTANNDEVLYMNTSGTLLQYYSWADFFTNQQLDANIYDPKVIYDSQADRFIMTVLHGSTASNSIVLVCFSQSNDPEDGWWIYGFPGNILSNNTWFDYPGLGVSNNEIYISGNLFTSGDNNFDQVIVFQIGKTQGYTGADLNYTYWTGFTATPFPAFTLQPASWGQQGNYGPGILFVSNTPGGGGAIRVWDLTNDLGANPQFNSYTSTVPNYSPAADANQMGSNDLLDNGDCRIMNTFYLNGKLHFVHALDIGGSWNGIRYGRVDVASMQTQTSFIGNQGVSDLSYPAVASFGTSTSDEAVMVAFTRSSGAIHPEVRVASCDDQFEWSDGLLVKAGEAFVNFQQGTQRWGDYTGIARKHNAPQAKVWLAACYGGNIPGVMNNTWKTWVAEIGGSSTVDVVEETKPSDLRVFPNPMLDLFQLRFTLETRTDLVIELFDSKGGLVKLLHKDTRVPGEYLLSFNRGAISSGTYSLVIRNNNTVIGHETLVVQ